MNENQNEYVDINAHDSYPDSDQKIEIPTMKVIPLKKICMTIGELPSSYLETMTYYEMLVWFINFLRNNVIPTVNNNGEAVEELQQVVMNLQTYINNYKDSIDQDVEELEEYMNNYFENLDVQEEINNKLDQMLEDGVLEQIIEQYINSTALWCFDTVNDMTSSTNLIDGSYARTLGFYSINDGGNGVYFIRNKETNETANNMTTFAIGEDLIAELNHGNEINIKKLGAKGDDTTDDRDILHYALTNFKKVIVPNGTYKIGSNIIVNNDCVLQGYDNSTLHYTAGSENIGPDTNHKLNMYNIKIVSDAGIAYHMNREGHIDTRVENCNIYGNSYGILVNGSTDNGKDMYINNNTIDVSGDAIEINTHHTTENKFKNINITNNILKVTRGSGTTSGFPIGIAGGVNINVSNNVIDGARREAIHVEDYSEEININGNTINNCNYHGMRINTVSDSYKRCLISNNIINGNKNEGTVGIELTTAPTGTTDKYILNGNYISNFDTGIVSYRDLIVDNTSIVNCNKAFATSDGSFIGKIKLVDTPVLFNKSSISYTVIDDINFEFSNNNSMINIDNFITCSNNEGILQINKLKYKLYKPITTEDPSKVIKLLKVGTNVSFDGTITCIITTGAAARGKSISKVTIANGEITKELIAQKNNGVFSGSGSFSIDSDGYLIVSPYNPNQSSGQETCTIEFDGKLIISGSYNV